MAAATLQDAGAGMGGGERKSSPHNRPSHHLQLSAESLSRVQLTATPWTVALQALLWDFPGKNAAMGYHVLLQGIFLTQRLDPRFQPCRQFLYR